MADKIKTLVVLVQENRSFDYMLGCMKSLNLEIDGVTGVEFNRATTAVHYEYVDPDLGHSFQAIYEQVYGNHYTWGSMAPATKPGVDVSPTSGSV